MATECPKIVLRLPPLTSRSFRRPPDHPLGAPMVSPEGPCAAFYQHRRA